MPYSLQNFNGLNIELVGGVAADYPTTPIQPIPLTAGGTAVVVTIAGGGGGLGNAAAGLTGAAVPLSADYSGINIGGNLVGQTGFSLTNSKPAAVAIVDANGNQITSFGGGSAASNYHAVSAATTNAANIKASPGTLVGYNVFNNGGYPVYIKFHNTAGTPTAGVGVVRTVGVQAGSQFGLVIGTGGMSFSTGIGITIVKNLADADATAIALNDCVVDVNYV